MDRRSDRRMRRVVRAGCLAVALAVLSPTPARADFWCWLLGNCGEGDRSTAGRTASPERGAPEIDPGALASALALAAGGAALLGDRFRRRR